jgi:predicted ATP-grasp superfamily ATP-dependent carboligase
MKEKFDILITDSRYKHSLAAVRALGKEGLRIATCSEGFSPTKFSRFSKKSFTYNRNNFLEKILYFIENNEVKLVLPIGYWTNLTCSKNNEKIMKYSNLVLDNYEKVSNVSNKRDIIPILKKSGVIIPKTFVVNELSDVEKVIFSNKMIIKSVIEETGKKVDYANSKESLRELLKLRLEYGPQIVQDYITGEGRGFFAFCKNGKILQSFQHKRIRQYPESGGVSSCAESIYDQRLGKIGEIFIRKLKWTGPVMLEFIYNLDSKEYLFLEMNPKFWGSLDLSIFCGLNFPKIPFDLINNNKIIRIDYPVGKRFQWVLPEDTLRIKTSINKKNAKEEWLKDLLNKNVGKDISYIFKDPLPTIIRIIGTFFQYLFKK